MAACNARRQAKARRAHSAVDLCPDVVIEAEDEDLLGLEDMLGEVDTLFSDLGCNGDCGAEFERMSGLRAVPLMRSREDACRRTELDDGAFIASLRDLSVALIISVAKIDLSFGDNWLSSLDSVLFSFSANETFLPLVFAPVGFVALDDSADFDGFFEFPAKGLGAIGVFGNRRSLSIVAVAGVHVVVELTAARIESAVS